MALQIKIKHNKKIIDGYLHIDAISFLRSQAGSGSNLTTLPSKFKAHVSYSIFEKDQSGEMVSRGIHNFPWDENLSISNVFSYAYNELKNLKIYEPFKDV